MRGLKRTQRVSIGYIHDVTNAPAEPGRGTIAVEKQETATHRGDMFTKAPYPGKYSSVLKTIGVIPYADRPSRTKPPAAVKTDRSKLVENKKDKDNVNKNKMEKNDVEKAAPAIVVNHGNCPNLGNNGTSCSSPIARWTRDPWENEYVAEPRYAFLSTSKRTEL